MKVLSPIVEEIQQKSLSISKLSNDQLRQKTIEFRTSASLMAIFRDSKFGIGENNPTSLLTVGGDSSFNGFVDISDNLYVNGDVSFQRNLDVSGQLTASSSSIRIGLSLINFKSLIDITYKKFDN